MGLRKNSAKKLRKERSKWKVESAKEFEKREKELQKMLNRDDGVNPKGRIYVTAGKRKGFALEIPPKTRAITSRIRKTIFDILQEDIVNRTILDLYAGTGAFGIEALSRGAKNATFIDDHKIAIDMLKENLEKTGFTKESTVLEQRADDFLRNAISEKETYDIIFIDPPYKIFNRKDKLNIETLLNTTKRLLPGMLEDIPRKGNEAPEDFPGSIILKHPSKYEVEELNLPEISLLVNREVGNNAISFFIIDKYVVE